MIHSLRTQVHPTHNLILRSSPLRYFQNFRNNRKLTSPIRTEIRELHSTILQDADVSLSMSKPRCQKNLGSGIIALKGKGPSDSATSSHILAAHLINKDLWKYLLVQTSFRIKINKRFIHVRKELSYFGLSANPSHHSTRFEPRMIINNSQTHIFAINSHV
jgi:hypothetical protein